MTTVFSCTDEVIASGSPCQGVGVCSARALLRLLERHADDWPCLLRLFAGTGRDRSEDHLYPAKPQFGGAGQLALAGNPLAVDIRPVGRAVVEHDPATRAAG